MTLIPAIIETRPGETGGEMRVYLDVADAYVNAARLANITGRKVRVEFEPSGEGEVTRRAPAAPTQPAAAATAAPRPELPAATTPPGPRPARSQAPVPAPGLRSGGPPEQVLQRILAEPRRVFRRGDFEDLGSARQIENILYRLASEQHRIERVSRGRFRAPQANGHRAEGGRPST